MDVWEPMLLLLGLAAGGLLLVRGVGLWLAADREPLEAEPFGGGLPPGEHAFSRFHVRWYPITMIFLAFDMEMLFMYPWVRVVSEKGPSAVAEMFLFLGVLFAGVVYARREGAFRWT
ncbi:NADH-quinone oxidoreductase subunit A [Streptomyces sp. F63]|uniref:NADH-quinone oxidoreductase subunit A n=1 Tax=Streptomyces sp. F63 TaxID=2824887 RepID=UPI001FFCCE5D|nr:NADH-quinone oxidoreductase subunit A [Streptomyces sp. F63]